MGYVQNYIKYYSGVIFFVLILLAVVHYFVAKNFGMYAEEKGYSKSKYFWICFLLLPIGMIMVTAMPDKKLRELLSKTQVNEQPAAAPKTVKVTPVEKATPTKSITPTVKKCPNCGTPIKENAKFCVKCGKKLDQ